MSAISEVERLGVEGFLEALEAELREGTDRPRAVLRRYIPKADGRKRPRGIPTIRDRVVQMAAKLVLESIFEADFRPDSYGFRPQRGATQALERLRQLGARGGDHVLDPDTKGLLRTGNAARKFNAVDSYVWWRLQRFMWKRKGRHLDQIIHERRWIARFSLVLVPDLFLGDRSAMLPALDFAVEEMQGPPMGTIPYP